MAAAVRELIECLGEDPSREGLLQTPTRSAKALLTLTENKSQRPSTRSTKGSRPPVARGSMRVNRSRSSLSATRSPRNGTAAGSLVPPK
jgi:hypothetical protein